MTLSISPDPYPLPVEDFLSQTFPPLEQVIGPFTSESVSIGASKTGLGKSHLALAMAHAVATGTDLMHWKVPKARNVLYIDGEMGPSQLQERISAYDWTESGSRFHLINAMSWIERFDGKHPNFAHKYWQNLLRSWASDFSLVILDNVMSLVDADGKTVSSDEYWSPVQPLNRELRSMGCAVVWFDHTNDTGQIFGTKTKAWHMDLVFALSATPAKSKKAESESTCAFTINFTKVRGRRTQATSSVALSVTFESNAPPVWASRDREMVLDKEHEKVRTLNDSGLSQREIAGKLDISAAKVNRILKHQRKT